MCECKHAATAGREEVGGSACAGAAGGREHPGNWEKPWPGRQGEQRANEPRAARKKMMA